MDTSQQRRALRLEVFTVSWNVLEAVVAIAAGVIAGSIALVGFGLDSVIETASAVILLWRLRQTGESEEAAEHRAVKLVGISFFVLAAYVTWEAVSALMLQEAPQTSLVGIILAGVSLIVMPILGRAKARLAREMGSRALAADSQETMACAYLSATLLGGLLANALFGWWWADPVAALGIVVFLLHEGWEAFEED